MMWYRESGPTGREIIKKFFNYQCVVFFSKCRGYYRGYIKEQPMRKKI